MANILPEDFEILFLWWWWGGTIRAPHSHCVLEEVVRALVQRETVQGPGGEPTLAFDPFRAEFGADDPFREGPTAELRRPGKERSD